MGVLDAASGEAVSQRNEFCLNNSKIDQTSPKQPSRGFDGVHQKE
jgi:hypothetical protein